MNPDPRTARARATRDGLMALRVKAELEHARWSDGTCIYRPPCASCDAIEQIDQTVRYLDDEIQRVENPEKALAHYEEGTK